MTKQELKSRAQQLAQANTDFTTCKQVIDEIHQAFASVTGLSGTDQEIARLAAIPAARGKALSLNHAAQCFIDYHRTDVFVNGIYTAINEKLGSQEPKPLHIFYAGCGPYAPLFTLVAPLFDEDLLQFTLLEINPESVASAKKLIAHFGLEPYIKDVVCADAITYQFEGSDAISIFISETLDALLYRECYVPIMMNWRKQLPDSATIIPENVFVELIVEYEPKADGTAQVEKIGHAIDVMRDIATVDEHPTELENLPTISFDFDESRSPKNLFLCTQVFVHGKYVLAQNSSSLTHVLKLELPQPYKHQTIDFTYSLHPDVELKYELGQSAPTT